jgi:hypothetical protein
LQEEAKFAHETILDICEAFGTLVAAVVAHLGSCAVQRIVRAVEPAYTIMIVGLNDSSLPLALARVAKSAVQAIETVLPAWKAFLLSGIGV